MPDKAIWRTWNTRYHNAPLFNAFKVYRMWGVRYESFLIYIGLYCILIVILTEVMNLVKHKALFEGLCVSITDCIWLNIFLEGSNSKHVVDTKHRRKTLLVNQLHSMRCLCTYLTDSRNDVSNLCIKNNFSEYTRLHTRSFECFRGYFRLNLWSQKKIYSRSLYRADSSLFRYC